MCVICWVHLSLYPIWKTVLSPLDTTTCFYTYIYNTLVLWLYTIFQADLCSNSELTQGDEGNLEFRWFLLCHSLRSKTLWENAAQISYAFLIILKTQNNTIQRWICIRSTPSENSRWRWRADSYSEQEKLKRWKEKWNFSWKVPLLYSKKLPGNKENWKLTSSNKLQYA